MTPLFPRIALPTLAALALAGCDDSTSPVVADIDLDAAAVAFGALDVDFGPGLTRTVVLTNQGTTEARVGMPILEGAAPSDFRVEDGSAGGSLAAGASLAIGVVFDPSAQGSRDAVLRIPIENGPMLSVALAGTGEAVVYRQVDRVGIPALNTVFNHPPQFSKVDYNRASPSQDLASYRALFETVLGAVANPDPASTASLLLPDALPVSLSQATSFASLTGRDPADDAVDVALTVVVGIESLRSDNVDANDRAFLSAFPYLAPPHG